MKTKLLSCVLLALTACCTISCSTDDSDDIGSGDRSIQSLGFSSRIFDLFVEEETLPELNIRTGSGTETYTAANEYGLNWHSSIPNIASISDNGIIRGEAVGTSRISARTPDNLKQAALTVNVLQSEQLDQPLARDMIYTSGHMLSDNSVMQSFDLGADGYMYCSQVGRGSNNYNVIIVRKQANAANYESRMLLPYAGHGNNIAVEQDGADMYVWVGSYGTRSSEGDYTLSQTMARIKYAPGKTLKPSECYEQYWIPQRRNLQASLDPDNDIILFWCTNSNYSTRYIYLYRLSEVKALPESSEQLSFSITWGGETGGPASVTEKPTVMVKNLSQLEPLATITLPQSSPLTVGSNGNQGHDVKNGKIYYYEGAGNNNDGATPSTATVSIFDFNGNLIRRHDVAAIEDMGALASQGLTSTGYMEPEGIKFYDGMLYCGFASRSTDDVRRAVVLQYDLMQEP